VSSLSQLGFGDNPDRTVPDRTVFVPHDAYLERSHRAGPPVATDKGLLVAPPGFEEPLGPRR
jgi:hypothetical protein